MASLSFLSILLAFIPFVFALVVLSLKWNFNGLPWNWPFFGMTPTILFHIHRVHHRLTHILQQSPSTFLFKGAWFAGLDFFLTVDPSNIHHILSTNFDRYPKGPDFKYIFDVLGDGIFNSDSVSWKTQRTTAHALVRQEKFLHFLEKIAMKKVREELVSVLESVCENGSVLDLQDLFQRFSFDSTCMLVTGFDLHSLSLEFPQVPFSKAMDDIEEVIFLRHFIPKKIWEFQKKLQIGHPMRLQEAWEIIDQTIANLIATKRESLNQLREEKDEEGVDLITSYMENKENDDKMLRDTVLNFMIAGRDTLSSALSWFFFCLSNNPTVEAKIREELETTIPTSEPRGQWRMFSIKEVDKLVYFHGALCETLRLYPPVPFQHKIPSQPDVLPSGHHVNPKTKIIFSLYALGRMSDVWGKDCMEFKPERWVSEKGRIMHVPSHKFLAFNAGPRTCLGKQVAFTEMKIVAAAMIHNYAIVQETGQEVVPSASIILHMKHGLKVRVTKRWSC
ncbi:alkane hydroxylase MAH1-like [Cucurbita pepo subsp. pepo]|uniref:alkane hydroxylase MAH1-like n=1 Tax=Cucurbita pepo subsp. pepo TaxID=3664 RepID=UPI000C9D7A21|nr:alkane hydroxylase MAH1-like [Cucurbita pepo subsp. pepo]